MKVMLLTRDINRIDIEAVGGIGVPVVALNVRLDVDAEARCNKIELRSIENGLERSE